MLIFVSVLAVMASAAVEPNISERRRVRYDAEFLAVWLSRRISLAAREASTFTMVVGEDDDAYYILIRWLDGVNGMDVDRYDQNYAAISYEGDRECSFSGTWCTLTPAATFVLRSKSIDGIRFDVTVSGTGYVSVTEVE